jgi:hypothetical protein
VAQIPGEVMKTRSELILDFMLALASNDSFGTFDPQENANDIYEQAVALVNKYMETL